MTISYIYSILNLYVTNIQFDSARSLVLEGLKEYPNDRVLNTYKYLFDLILWLERSSPYKHINTTTNINHSYTSRHYVLDVFGSNYKLLILVNLGDVYIPYIHIYEYNPSGWKRENNPKMTTYKIIKKVLDNAYKWQIPLMIDRTIIKYIRYLANRWSYDLYPLYKCDIYHSDVFHISDRNILLIDIQEIT